MEIIKDSIADSLIKLSQEKAKIPWYRFIAKAKVQRKIDNMFDKLTGKTNEKLIK